MGLVHELLITALQCGVSGKTDSVGNFHGKLIRGQVLPSRVQASTGAQKAVTNHVQCEFYRSTGPFPSGGLRGLI
jgi:hypothetical protein